MKWTVPAGLKNLPNVLKYLMIGGVIALISLLFPNNVRFQYDFYRGQSWQYDDLYAPFDFPISKTEAELALERQQIRAQFIPYYSRDVSVAEQQQNRFHASLNDVILQSEVSISERKVQAYQDFGEAYLAREFERGIAQIDSSHLARGQDYLVQVLTGNKSVTLPIRKLRTAEAARQDLYQAFSESNLSGVDILVPIIEPLIVPNITYNDSLTSAMLADRLDRITRSKGMVSKGDLIVPKNGIITDDIYQALVSFRAQYNEDITRKKSYWGVFAGYLLLTTLIIGIFVLYLRYSSKDIFFNFNKLLFILLWIVLFSYLVFFVESADNLSTYLVPFCIVPIVLRNFFSQRVALFTHIVIILIASFLSALGYEFTFLNILAGIVAVLTRSETREWSRFFTSILLIFLAYGLGYLGLSLILDGDIMQVDYRIYIWFVVNAVLTLLAYPLIPLFGRIFGFTSSISLAELADLNRPLLKELSLKAPGTLQHSLQVANLAESACEKIGARSLLVKVGAMYHDIGKVKEPRFFVENQQAGVNPHTELDNNLLSARKILDHVNEGVKMAVKKRLPKEIVDFIKTHHGTTRVEYFLRKQKQEHPDEPVDPSEYQYPGPKPTTKEQVVLMMADSIEAASKSMQNPTGVEIDQLVDNIVQSKIDHGQFTECALTFSELQACKEVFKSMLRSIYHVRVEYPPEKTVAGPQASAEEE